MCHLADIKGNPEIIEIPTQFNQFEDKCFWKGTDENG